jgi:basic membrane protein A and related proteins
MEVVPVKRILRVFALAALVMGMASAAFALKVGLVTDTGGLNDRSFNQLAYQGLQQAKSELGTEIAVVQSKAQGDYVPNLTRFAQQKYDMVVAVGFLMHDAVEQVSKEYPDTKFLLIDSEVTDRANVTSAMFSEQQAGYLVGALAGMVEADSSVNLPGLRHNDTIGVVGGMSIPPVNRYIAGYYQGARAQDPAIKILLGYTGNFDDPASGKSLAQAQHSKGADIIFQVAGGTGIGVIQAAKDGKYYGIGVDVDQAYLAPDNVLTSAEKRVDVAVFDTIKNLNAGTFTSGVHTFDLQNNGVGIGKMLDSLPAAMKAKVEQIQADIKSGKIQVSDQIPQQ